MGIELPLTVEMTVMETEPAIKGASVSNVGKPAKMETGLVVQVPPFIAEGDGIRVDTATGAYVEPRRQVGSPPCRRSGRRRAGSR